MISSMYTMTDLNRTENKIISRVCCNEGGILRRPNGTIMNWHSSLCDKKAVFFLFHPLIKMFQYPELQHSIEKTLAATKESIYLFIREIRYEWRTIAAFKRR